MTRKARKKRSRRREKERRANKQTQFEEPYPHQVEALKKPPFTQKVAQQIDLTFRIKPRTVRVVEVEESDYDYLVYMAIAAGVLLVASLLIYAIS